MNTYVRSAVQGVVIGALCSLLAKVVTDAWLFGIGVAIIAAIVLIVSIRFFPNPKASDSAR